MDMEYEYYVSLSSMIGDELRTFGVAFGWDPTGDIVFTRTSNPGLKTLTIDGLQKLAAKVGKDTQAKLVEDELLAMIEEASEKFRNEQARLRKTAAKILTTK